MITATIVILALLLNAWLGEPRRWNPLAAFRSAARWLEARIKRDRYRPRTGVDHPDTGPVGGRHRTDRLAAAMSVPSRGWLIWLGACLLWLPVAAGSVKQTALAVTDDLGRSVTLAAPAQRIVSLAPHTTELLFAAGAGERVVGAVDFSDYPPAATHIPRVGSAHALDFERILALRPDLIVGWHSGNGPRALQRLRELGLTVYESEPRTLQDIPRTLEHFGTLAGTADAATAAASAFRREHERLRALFQDKRPVATFYQIWDRPLMTINGDHMISEIIVVCGGRNVFEKLAPLAGTIDIEAVLRAQPQAIVAGGTEHRTQWLDDWQRWRQLPAVRHDNLFFVPPSLLQRQGPRVLQGAKILCEHLETARQRLAESGS